MLRESTFTVWLKANARDHWDRVVAQGDVRPMKNRENAMSELKALLRDRKSLYAEAQITVDTSSITPEAAVDQIVRALSRPRPPRTPDDVSRPPPRQGTAPQREAATMTKAPKKKASERR
jgi:hypothetical protein